ncbi:MAG: DUF2232 domain-containing protein [Alphaproteobacteria bacterium]
MSQALALAVLAGIISGALGLAPLSGSFALILVSYFVQLPMMLAGLTMGLAAAIVAALAAIVLSALIGGMLAALIFAVAFALPALLVVRQALLSRQDPEAGLVWYPPGHILAELTVLSVLGLALAFFTLMGEEGGLIGFIEIMLAEAFGQFTAATGQPALDPEAVRSRAVFVPSVVACSWLMMAVVNGVVAQAIAVRSGWNRRPSPQLAELELPFWLWPLMGVAVVLAMLGSTGIGLFGRSALIVLIMPFGFLGLAVIHKFANRWSYRQLGLAAVYAGIIVFNWPILAVIALGLVEDWAHLRRYM